MNLTHEAALKIYARLCAKSKRELRRGHSPLLPYLRAMSCVLEFAGPFPSVWDLRYLAERDRKNILRLIGHLTSDSFSLCDFQRECDFRREFDRIEA